MVENVEMEAALRCKIKNPENEIYILYVVYIQPKHANFDLIMGHLSNLIQSDASHDPRTKILLQGDFNARIGELNNLEDEEWMYDNKMVIRLGRAQTR